MFDNPLSSASICRSIRERKLLMIHYKGGKGRVVEPYVYGRDRKGLKLSAYQLSGYSSSGKLPGWRMFTVKLINHVLPLDLNFQVRDTYNPKYRIITEVICKV